MCSNYRAVVSRQRLLEFFGVEMDPEKVPGTLRDEVWPTDLAPFIRLRPDGAANVAEGGHFGLLPHFSKETAYGRRTYNARSETVHELASFRRAWANGQRAIVPAECIYEPCWETGKAVRWRIQHPGDVPMAIAGIWTQHPFLLDERGQPRLSFAMLTVNAAGHPVFSRLHRPDDEKRMVVILERAEHDRWLRCPPSEASTFFRQWHGPLEAFPAPLPPRARRAKPAAETGDGELF